MNEPLHPLSLGEVLDSTAQLYRDRFLVFFGISMVPSGFILAAALIVVSMFAAIGLQNAAAGTSGAAQAMAVIAIGVTSLLALPLFVSSAALGWAALCQASAQSFLGEPITIRSSYKAVWKHGWNHVGLYLLLTLFVGIIPFSAVFGIIAISAVLSAAAAGTVQSIVGVAIFVFVLGIAVAALWILLRLCLAFPATVVEGISAWSALKRSSSLSTGTRGRIILLFLLGTALSQLIAIVLIIPFIVLVAFVPALQGPQHAGAVGAFIALVFYGVSFTAQAFVRPVYGIALTLFYFDQRIRKEGFDIELLMTRAGLEQTNAQAQIAAATPWTGIIRSQAPQALAANADLASAGGLQSEPPSTPPNDMA